MPCSMQSRVLWYSVDEKPLKRSIKIQSTNRKWKENILYCSSIALRLQVGVKPWTKGNVRWAQLSSHQQICYSQRPLHPGEIPEELKAVASSCEECHWDGIWLPSECYEWRVSSPTGRSVHFQRFNCGVWLEAATDTQVPGNVCSLRCALGQAALCCQVKCSMDHGSLWGKTVWVRQWAPGSRGGSLC